MTNFKYLMFVGELHLLSSKFQSVMADISRLCTLVHWLLMSLKSLKDSGRIEVTGESPVLSTDGNASPKVSLTKLLHKIISLSAIDNEHLSRSALLLARMIGNTSLTAKLKKIPLLVRQDRDSVEEPTFRNTDSMLLLEEASIKLAAEKLEFLKSRLRNQTSRKSTNAGKDATGKLWTVSKSWSPCPIGMLPCSFSSTAVLPVLDKADGSTSETNKIETDMDGFKNSKREADGNVDVNENATKRLRTAREELEHENASRQLRMARGELELVLEQDLSEVSSPMKGRLLIGGIWKKVSEEELADIESNIRIFC